MKVTKELKTWSQLRKLKVVNKGLIRYDIQTLGDFLDVGEFDYPYGRKEFKSQDLYKISSLLIAREVELEDIVYETIDKSDLLKDWLPKFDRLFRSKGVLYDPVHCEMGINLGLERNVCYKDLRGNEMVFLYCLMFSLKDDNGNEVTKGYHFDFLKSEDRDLQKLLVDFIKSPYWYDDYIESLYEEVLVYLFDWFEGQLSYGEPVSRIVRVLSTELVRLDAKHGV